MRGLVSSSLFEAAMLMMLMLDTDSEWLAKVAGKLASDTGSRSARKQAVECANRKTRRRLR